MLYKKTIRVLMIKNGAKGISLFILVFFLENKIIKRPAIDPIQKDKVSAAIPFVRPSIHPIPKASLASPNPIHRPRDTSQSKAKGIERSGPEAIDMIGALIKIGPKPV